MESNNTVALLLGALLLVGVFGLVAMFNPSSVGLVSAYQHVQHTGGVEEQPDPHTQYITIDEGVCNLATQRYTTFLTWVDHQCQELNHGRQSREASCRYHGELDAEVICRPAPVFENVRPPQYLT